VIHQRRCNFTYEILVIDNNSPNKYIEAILRYVKKHIYTNVVIYKNSKNIGMVENWNRGVNLSNGKWISFLHDDDLLHEEYLYNLQEILVSDKIDGLCSNSTHFENEINNSLIDRNTSLRRKIINKLKNRKLMRMNQMDTVILNNNPYGEPTCGLLLKRENIIKMGGFNEKNYPISDWVFLYKYSKNFKLFKPFFITGFYRWSINTSFNAETVLSFVSGYKNMGILSSKKNIICKTIHKYFRLEQHYQNLQTISKLMAKAKLTPSDFEHICPFKKRYIRLIIYKILLKSYWRFKKLFSILLIRY